MEQLIIRKANIEDAQFMALLARVTFTETFGHYFSNKPDLLDYYDKTFSVSKIKASLAKENNVFWISFLNELPVGYAKLKKVSNYVFIDSDKVSQLQKIYILKDFISKKIGYKMQAEMFKEAIKIGNKYIWLSVLESNNRAISFYAKNGFTEIGKHSFEIGQQNFSYIAMKKEF